MAAEQWIERVVERAITVQQVPAPTFAESARAALVRRLFVQEGLADVQVDTAGNVLARLPGEGECAAADCLGTPGYGFSSRYRPDHAAGWRKGVCSRDRG